MGTGKKKVNKALFCLYAPEDAGLDLIVKKFDEDPMQSETSSRSSVMRTLIRDGMRRYKVSKADLAAALAEKKDAAKPAAD